MPTAYQYCVKLCIGLTLSCINELYQPDIWDWIVYFIAIHENPLISVLFLGHRKAAYKNLLDDDFL